MRPKISRADIRLACGDTFFVRGRSYFEQGRVESVKIAEENPASVLLEGAVSGSNGHRYLQKVAIHRSDDLLDIDGDCSCPMEYNCKHVAAICLVYRERLSERTVASNASTDGILLQWLQRLAEHASDTPGTSEFLVYVLKLAPAQTANPRSVQVELRLVRRRSKGVGYTKGRKIRIYNLIYDYQKPAYLRDLDRDIARLLATTPESAYQSDPTLSGIGGHLALEKMVESGRCHWEESTHPALGAGETRQLSIQWRTSERADMHLALSVDPPAHVVLTEPPMYLDAAQNRVGELDTLGFNARQLRELLRAPSIGKDRVEEFSRALIRDFPGLPLPPPVPVLIQVVEGRPPVPALRLTATKAGPAHAHLLHLDFQYGPIRVSARPEAPSSLIDQNGTLYRVARDPEKERAALAVLLDCGFETVRLEGAGPAVLRQGGNSIAGTSRWSAFIRETLPRLESEGWLVERDDQFLLRFESGEWVAQLDADDQQSNDWFGLRFDLEVGGQRLPLLPIIEPLLALSADEIQALPEILSVPLRSGTVDHQYVDLPSSRLRPFLETIRELFGRIPEQKSDSLRISRYEALALNELEQQGTRVQGGDSLRELGRRLADFDGIQVIGPPRTLEAHLRPYQRIGLSWLQFLRQYDLGGILADDMGLGKTVQTLAHLAAEKEAGRLDRPALVIAPTSLMSNWRRESERFTPGLRVLVLHGPNRRLHFAKIRNNDLVLTTYPLLARDQVALARVQYHYLILDEAQTVKNPRAKAARIVRTLNTRHRLCLTGTPLENHLGELWAQFDFLMPGFLGTSERFKREWRTPIERHGETEKRRRLARRVAPFLLRRRKQDVLAELPPRTDIIRSIPLTDEQATLYEGIRLTMEKRVREAVAARGLSRSHITILDALLKLRQICCHPSLLAIGEARKVGRSAKLDMLMELLPEMLEEGRRVLLFSQFTTMLALIESELEERAIGFTSLTGQTIDRERAIDRFRSGEVDVFLISLKAGGVGLNLTEADTVILYDPWWNPAVQEQAAGRAHRIGQDKPVFVYRLICEGTVEEKILALQDKKQALADGVYREGEAQGAGFTPEDLKELFSPTA